MLNNIVIMGRFTTDPETRKAGDHTVCAFTVAVQRSRNRDKTDFIPVKAWDRMAEIIKEHFHKGDRIVVTGNLQNNSYQASDGTQRSFFEVELESFEFVEKMQPKN